MATAAAARKPSDSIREADEIVAVPTALEAVTRGEIDIQIRTARAYPRSIQAFKQSAEAMACLDEDTAASCCYKLPARKGGDGKPIEGPSVRLAEIIATAWQHMRVQGVIVDEQDRHLVLGASAWDLQNNNAWSVQVRRRITTKDGARYSEDMINTTANAGISIATRNVVFHVVPRSYVNELYLKCKEVARGSQATLAVRRQKALEWFNQQGAPAAKVFALLGVRGIEDITLDHLETLTGYRTSLREGETTLDELFADAQAAANKPDPVTQAMSTLECSEADARRVLAAFDSLKMNEAHRLVQMRTLKGRAAELLVMLEGMGATVPPAESSAPATSESQQPATSQAPAETRTAAVETKTAPAAETTTTPAETAAAKKPAGRWSL